MLSVAVAAASLLAACGGGGDGDQTVRVSYGKLVSFGDSLSDVGSYAVSGVAAVGGGKFTVNGVGNKIWVEDLAGALGVAAPCAAETGLNAIQAIVGFPPVPASMHTGCFAYGQGGARVTNAIGPGNVALFNPNDTSTYSNAIGALTVPVVTQIANHLAATGGSFAADDLVTVLAGANDVFMNLAAVGAGAMTPTQAVTAMGTAGAQLAAYVKTMIVANGAQRVVVVNVPDITKTPMGLAMSAGTNQLVAAMIDAFNSQLSTGVSGDASILFVDAFTRDQDQAAHPEQYALTNVTTPVCTSSSSLTCSANTLIAGDTSHYKFADSVHPTPYGSGLLAQLITNDLAKKGWL
jgi:phospholipase/lecithinase/hemolysin